MIEKVIKINAFLYKNGKSKVFGKIYKRIILAPLFFLTGKINLRVFLLILGLSTQKLIKFCNLNSTFNHIFLTDQYHAKDFIKDGDTIIDAGANIGLFSLLASQLSPAGKIIAFEPVERTCSVFHKIIGKKPNITLEKLALGDENMLTLISKSNEFSVSNSIIGTSFNRKMKDSYAEREEIEVVKLDDYVREKGIKRVDFIKIDVEGYEKKVLLGAAKIIAKFLPVISISAYHNTSDKVQIPRIVKNISSKYRYFLSSRSEEDFIFYPDCQKHKKIEIDGKRG